jgi:hypothetical protein
MTRCAQVFQDLVAALNRIGKDNHSQEVGWAEKASGRILRAIKFEKDKKLRNQRYGQFTRPWRGRKPAPGIQWAQHLATTKLKKKRWGRGKKPSDKVLSEIAARTAQILIGSKTKSHKNFVEQIAAGLTGEIRREWFSSRGRVGRPPGKRTDSDSQRLSLEEVVSVVLPIIEEIAAAKVKVVISASEAPADIKSPSFQALVAAVKTEIKFVSTDSIARAVARVRRPSASNISIMLAGTNIL